MPSVKIPGVEVKFPCGACEAICVEQQVTLHSFWFYLFISFFKYSTGLQVHGDGEAAVHKLLLVRGVYQWIFFPLWFVATASRISPNLQQHMPEASRIFPSL